MLGRILYFVLFGWWLGILWSSVAYVLCLSIIGLPLGLTMFNVMPKVLTLKPTVKDEIIVDNENGKTNTIRIPKQELPMIIRALYFLFVGWELTGVWISIALCLSFTIIGLPLGLMMFNHIPLILTLKMNY